MFSPTNIPDLLIYEPKVFSDQRGYFYESYNKKVFAEAGILDNFLQDNQSKSTYGVLRGLHFQRNQHQQSKLVRVLFGSVLDVAVDIRADSSTYGKHFSIELSGNNNKQLYIPRGFAHGFIVLSEHAIFSYKCDNYYNKESESGILYNDPDLDIDWQLPTQDIIVNARDKSFGYLKEIIK